MNKFIGYTCPNLINQVRTHFAMNEFIGYTCSNLINQIRTHFAYE
jgi:hypothetical protein